MMQWCETRDNEQVKKKNKVKKIKEWKRVYMEWKENVNIKNKRKGRREILW